MKIGQLSKISGVATSAIRYYDKLGLLGESHRNNGSTRRFEDDMVVRLQIIKGLQAMGFSLEKVALFFQQPDQKFDHQKVLSTIDGRLNEMDNLIAQIKCQKNSMIKVQKILSDTWANGDCLTSEQVQQISKQLYQSA